MRENKQQRQITETNWGTENKNDKSFCKGSFYIWNRVATIECNNRESCEKYTRYREIIKKGEFEYEKPQVRFYYVDSFRKCNLYLK